MLLFALTLVWVAPPANASPTCAPTSPSTPCDLAVTVSVSPSTVTAGQTIAARVIVTNSASAAQVATLSYTVTPPKGRPRTVSQQVTMQPGSNLFSQSYLVEQSDKKGTYTLSVSAADQSGTATDSASYQVI